MTIELLLTLWLGLAAPQAAHLTHAPGGELGPEVDPLGLAATAGTAEAGERGPEVDPLGLAATAGTAGAGERGPGIDPGG
jgi:hypothetical protein